MLFMREAGGRITEETKGGRGERIPADRRHAVDGSERNPSYLGPSTAYWMPYSKFCYTLLKYGQ